MIWVVNHYNLIIYNLFSFFWKISVNLFVPYWNILYICTCSLRKHYKKATLELKFKYQNELVDRFN